MRQDCGNFRLRQPQGIPLTNKIAMLPFLQFSFRHKRPQPEQLPVQHQLLLQFAKARPWFKLTFQTRSIDYYHPFCSPSFRRSGNFDHKYVHCKETETVAAIPGLQADVLNQQDVTRPSSDPSIVSSAFPSLTVWFSILSDSEYSFLILLSAPISGSVTRRTIC